MYLLEGNIGAGKSTFLKLVGQQIPQLQIVFEPVTNWNDEKSGQSLLENFFTDTPRWALTLETFAMKNRVKDHLQLQRTNNPHILAERSIYSGHYCFSLNCYKSGFISEMEWSVYSAVFNFLIPTACLPPHGFIYLQTDPETAYERIIKRDRNAEKEIRLEYLVAVHEHHEQFLVKKQNVIEHLTSVPVLILDGNQDFEASPTIMDQHIEKIKTFLRETQKKSLTPLPPSSLTSQQQI